MQLINLEYKLAFQQSYHLGISIPPNYEYQALPRNFKTPLDMQTDVKTYQGVQALPYAIVPIIGISLGFY